MISRSFENDNGAELFIGSIAERKKYMSARPAYSSLSRILSIRGLATDSRVRTLSYWCRVRFDKSMTVGCS